MTIGNWMGKIISASTFRLKCAVLNCIRLNHLCIKHSDVSFSFQMARHSLTLRAAQRGAAPTRPRLHPASGRSRSPRTSPPALFPSTIQTELCGPTTYSLRATCRHLRLPFRTPGPMGWTLKPPVPTPTSTTITRTSTAATTTTYFTRTPATAPQRWSTGSAPCWCPQSGAKASRAPAREVLRSVRGWSRRQTLAMWRPAPPPGAHRPSRILWRCMTQVDRSQVTPMNSQDFFLVLCLKKYLKN